MKKTFITIILLTIILFSQKNNNYTIPDESIRFRVIPNSNSLKDIAIKELVRKEVENTIISNSNVNSIEEERKLINKKLSTLESNIDNLLTNNNYSKEFKVKYGYNYFPEKKYQGKTYQEGYYESLVIELGEAKGDNYWCVLFPPLCLMELEETNTETVEYSSYFGEILKNLFN